MICANCGAKNEGGLFTGSDDFGDGAYVGIATERRFFCSDCVLAGKTGDVAAEISAEFAKRGLCGFKGRFEGRCRNHSPCIKHALLKCWACSSKATLQIEEDKVGCSKHWRV